MRDISGSVRLDRIEQSRGQGHVLDRILRELTPGPDSERAYVVLLTVEWLQEHPGSARVLLGEPIFGTRVQRFRTITEHPDEETARRAAIRLAKEHQRPVDVCVKLDDTEWKRDTTILPAS